ncbi:EamA-like transporter family protein [Pacificibacter marinus]|uniref:Putative inner membrane transporter yiJE n=2 Tax=Pacificibacter marinus TaxID=658057 RepID=A0A1Y5RA64_9RHOB|nr:EamA-like transporter family protein [Pacificibacter marinus]SLN12352.1 putative inner membrane transporter yiJE [Pacificibacter marinus]
MLTFLRDGAFTTALSLKPAYAVQNKRFCIGLCMRLLWLTILAMVAFAANSVLTRVALTGASDPFAFAALRVMSGALALLVLVYLRGSVLPLKLPTRVPSSLALTVYMLGFSLAYLSLPSGAGALILFGSVQISMFAGALFLKEPVPVQRWLGGMLALGGLVFLLWPDATAQFPAFAVFAMISAGVGWGIYSLIGRRARDPLADTALNFALSTIPTGIVWLLTQGALTGMGAVLAIVAGVVTSGFGYALWYRVLPQLGASRAGVAQLSVPVLAMLGGFVFLGEGITFKFVIASVLVLGGIGVSMLRRP